MVPRQGQDSPAEAGPAAVGRVRVSLEVFVNACENDLSIIHGDVD
jgi:hypothetical protein